MARESTECIFLTFACAGIYDAAASINSLTNNRISKEEKMSFQLLSLSRHSFLGRSISRHVREFHGGNTARDGSGGSVSRRNFLTNAAGAAGLAFWIPELGAAQGN